MAETEERIGIDVEVNASRYMNRVIEKITRELHKHIVQHIQKETPNKHAPSECELRKRRQDPPYCQNCDHLLEPFENLSITTRQNLYDEYEFIIEPLLAEVRKLVFAIRKMIEVVK